MKYKYVNGIQCLKCMDKIWSRYRHDFRKCKCGACYVDGGRSYTRVGFEDAGLLKPVLIRVTNREYAMDEAYEKRSRWPY